MSHPLLFLSELAFAVAGLICLGAGAYLFALVVAAFFYRERTEPTATPVRSVAVLVPAHNEADFVARCVRSLSNQTYPQSLYETIVLADNCTDDTAAIARRAGAEVLVRDEPHQTGKGRGLRWAMDRLLARPDPPDAIVVVDADSVANPGLIAALVGHLELGADAVQAEYLMLEDERPSPRSRLRAAALLLFHRVRFAGRAALGLPCGLVGNGMLFSRRLLEERPWTAYTSAEDLEYTINLRIHGVRPVFARSAQVRGPMPTSGWAAHQQRRRWEGGRLHVVRTQMPRLVSQIVRRRRADLVDAAVDLAVPPLGILALVAVAGTAVGVVAVAEGAVPVWAAAPWVALTVALLAFVLGGLRAGQAPVSMYLSLLSAPRFLFSKLIGTADVLRRGHATSWVRSERPGDTGWHDGTPIAGIPVMWSDKAAAVSQIMEAARQRSFLQVCTVNLDFLVNSRRDREVHAILATHAMNLPDGMPVTWLGRLRGVRGAKRTAGADLVPLLIERASEEGVPVFLLGGEKGVARQAADRLLSEFPSLNASVYEPPWASLDSMDDEEILRRLDEAQPGLLLAAFGHPKQDKWIHRHRERLPMAAIGVGCAFDLLAGRRDRAPSWMQRAGLEWLYRLCHEPGRLARRYAADFLWLVGFFIPYELYERALAGNS